MDENNVHTSVVIELANQEEPKDQKTYQIDIDEVETPKDYVIDQIFCGENITVYALFEVPEETSKTSEKLLVEVSNQNLNEGYRFFHRNSYNNKINEKKINGFKHNLPVMHPEEDLKFIANRDKKNESLYCLKHLGGDYNMLTPERKSSELKVLYSKEFVQKIPKPTKFKVVSKGVNTDIMQSPKIIEEIQKAVGSNISFINNHEKNVEVSSSSLSKSSYEVIQMEMHQSLTSLSSDSGCRRCNKRPSPDFFLVPLLMMEDGLLRHYKRENKNKREEKGVDPNLSVAQKASLGTNTDLSFDKIEQEHNETFQTKNFQNDAENYDYTKVNQKKEASNEKLKINRKDMIIQEIKKMQKQLNTLIKTLECNDFGLTTKENIKEPCSAVIKNLERMSEPLLGEKFQKNYRNLYERQIFLPFSDPKKAKTKSRTQNPNEVNKSETVEPPKELDINISLPRCTSFTSVSKNEESPTDIPEKELSNLKVSFQELVSLKSTRLSKSESNVRIIVSDVKYNIIHGLKKSMSLDLIDDKVEVLKKIRNFSLKIEGNLKAKINMRIPPTQETRSGDNYPALNCEMGDDVKINKKTKQSTIDLPSVAQGDEKSDTIGLKELKVNLKKNFNEEEGDAKLVYQKESLTMPAFEQTQQKVQFFDTDIVSSEALLKFKKILSPYGVKSKTSDKIAEPETKVISESEKPVTPIKSCRKINSTHLNTTKEKFNNKRANNKTKVVEKSSKFEGKDVFPPELDKKKSLSGIRKSTRNSADSKLHVDKLIKLNILSNHKIPPSTKSNHDEKPGTKNDRLPRPVSQKRDRTEHPFPEGKVLTDKFLTLLQDDGCQKKNVSGSDLKEINEFLAGSGRVPNFQEEVDLNLASEKTIPLSSNSSSVVVELFSKRPTNIDKFYSEIGEEFADLRKTSIKEKFEAEKKTDENSKNEEKPIVKSVWALTKVLLFEDGTKKLEVLEASLTPPEYCLNQTLKNESELN